MKKLNYLFYLLISLSFNACNETNHFYDFYDFYQDFFVDENNTIYIQSSYNSDDKDERKKFYLSQNKLTHQWNEVKNIHHNYKKISIVQNEIRIEEQNGTFIYKDTLPTIEDISDNTNNIFSNAKISYIPFQTNNHNTWDRKRVIASVITDRSVDKNGDYLYHSIYNFSLIKEEGVWNIKFINKIISKEGNYYTNGDILQSKFSRALPENDTVITTQWMLSTDEKALICYQDSNNHNLNNHNCFSQNENKIVIKKFGDIYPKEYALILDKYIEEYAPLVAPILYFFDKDNNMHLFYNDTKEAKGKYFNYVMFSEDEPTVPKYEQKIYRRGEK